MQKSVNEEKYCTKCGTELLSELVGAETMYEYGYRDWHKPYTAYDSKTGLRNWATRYYCPKIGFNHTNFKKRAYMLS